MIAWTGSDPDLGREPGILKDDLLAHAMTAEKGSA
jgi:hypothetical protein